MGKLSKEEVLLLNNLMYMSADSPFKNIADYKGRTVSGLLNDIDASNIENGTEYTRYTSGKEWKQIIEAARADEKLCDLKIEKFDKDENGGQVVLFNNTADNEAVVVYRGTGSPYEWRDNFLGGSATDREDGVSTEQQESALEWYQSQDLESYDLVTVSGHSKGGNKAKYITILDDSVDRCLSFDGQGFSDEFINKYESKIAQNQYKIQNHNVAGDYVNILLNDVGDKTYYKGYNYGRGMFLENHCPNTYMKYDRDGNFTLVETDQKRGVQKIDKFVNSYLRNISPDARKSTMNMIGTMVEHVLDKRFDDEFWNMFTDENNKANVIVLWLYSVLYGGVEQANAIVNNPIWPIPRTIRDQSKVMLDLIREVNNGEDLKVKSLHYTVDGVDSSGGNYSFEVKPAMLRTTSETILNQRRELSQMEDRIASVRKTLGSQYSELTRAMLREEQQVDRCKQYCEQLGKILKEVSKKYESTEEQLVVSR